ncbi:CU044_2847 family protein [Streptomyces akebiae]|uniref:CU044_2847 family protein n=1 Tax=Streptomyces akebiae TaxID=2865673 RepID=UPI002175E699|nr:CU044_2847 family protein [Streptomyces akebiae]
MPRGAGYASAGDRESVRASLRPTGGHVADVRIETVAVDATGSRQISSRTRSSSALGDRAAELEEAIVQASDIAQRSLSQVQRRDGWRVASMEVTFGLTLAAEAGVILSKASAEASFEVTLSVERVPESP